MTFSDVSWLLLIASLPTAIATARMRIWRAVKTQGCRALRDGAYLVPSQPQHEHALQEFANECIRKGGSAWLMVVLRRSADEAAACRRLFDRREKYAELRKTWKDANGGIP